MEISQEVGKEFIEIIPLFKWLIPILISALGLCVGYLALNTWRKELYGRNKYKVAFDLLLAVSNLYDKIDTEVRNPWLPQKPGDNNDTNWELMVYRNRLNNFYKYKRQFYNNEAKRAEVLFGDEMKGLVEELNKIMEEMREAYHNYEIFLHLQEKEGFGHGFEKGGADALRLLRGGGDKKNDYTVKLINAVKNIEDFLGPKVKK